MADGVIALELCAPDKEPISLEATEVTLPGAAGVFTITPGHTALVSTLIPGPIVIHQTGGNEIFYAVHGGFAEVRGNTLLVLADNFEAEEDIDHARAAAAEERAQERLRKITPDINAMRAEAALARAIARLRTANRNGYG